MQTHSEPVAYLAELEADRIRHRGTTQAIELLRLGHLDLAYGVIAASFIQQCHTLGLDDLEQPA